LPHVLRDPGPGQGQEREGAAEEHAVRSHASLLLVSRVAQRTVATARRLASTNAMQQQPYTRRLGSLVERKSS
jgi:hypothetical protein